MIAYKYRGLNDGEILCENRDIKTMLNNEIFAPTFDKLNDPFETESDESISHVIPFLKRIFQVNSDDIITKLNNIKDLKHKVGLYSLSKNVNDVAMWAYYASSQKGYCIGYETDLLIDNHISQAHLVDIKYLSNIPLVEINDISNSQKNYNDKTIITKLFASKSTKWEHEKEIRIIFESCGGLKNHHPNALKSIHFGLRMEDSFKAEMIELLSNRDIDFYQMVRIGNTYEIESKLVHKNNKLIENKLDESLFEIVNRKSMPTCEDFLIYYKGKIEGRNEIEIFIKRFREQNSIKQSNITVVDNKTVISLAERYDLSDIEYVTLAEHLVAISSFDCPEYVSWYPYQDINYINKGGMNLKK